jgi:hypothetical protein
MTPVHLNFKVRPFIGPESKLFQQETIFDSILSMLVAKVPVERIELSQLISLNIPFYLDQVPCLLYIYRPLVV